jgi:hypothetical protein
MKMGLGTFETWDIWDLGHLELGTFETWDIWVKFWR